MYQVRQWACNRHFAHGRTSALQYRLKSSTRVTLSSLLGLLLDHGGKEGPLPASTRFVSESSELWKQELWHSVCGTSMSGICYIIAVQYWEVCGTSFSGICYIIAELHWEEPPPQVRFIRLGPLSHVGDYKLGLCGTSMSNICYFIAEQYWEAWGLFWKRSVSLFSLGVLLVFGFFCLWLFWVFAVLLRFILMTPRYLFHLYSHAWEWTI